MSHMTGATSGAGTSYLPIYRVPEFKFSVGFLLFTLLFSKPLFVYLFFDLMASDPLWYFLPFFLDHVKMFSLSYKIFVIVFNS